MIPARQAAEAGSSNCAPQGGLELLSITAERGEHTMRVDLGIFVMVFAGFVPTRLVHRFFGHEAGGVARFWSITASVPGVRVGGVASPGLAWASVMRFSVVSPMTAARASMPGSVMPSVPP